MRIEHVSSRPFAEKKNIRRKGLKKALLLSGMFMVAAPLVTSAQVSPSALNGTNQSRTVCSGLSTDISNWLKVTDPDIGETLTWTVITQPSFGVITGDGATASAGGSEASPTGGMTYTPDPSATNDAFSVMVSDDNGGSTLILVTVTINSGPSLSIGTIDPVCQGITSAKFSFWGLENVGPDTADFSYTGAMESWTVPDFVTTVKFDLQGAAGGHDSHLGTGGTGKGGRVTGNMAVTPGSALNLFIGGVGADGVLSGVAQGGFNGGGNASFYFYASGGAGGGATDIRVGGTALADRKVIAGGGGGNGADLTEVFMGGDGGGLTGGNSVANVSGSTSRGGTQALGGAPASYPGWTSGGFGTLGMGGAGSSQGISGGGGGGYYGGGGGIWNGGGGGSSYSDVMTASGVVHTRGTNTGNGTATLYYTIPGTYTIHWDATAFAAGFEDQPSLPLPDSVITFPVPDGVDAGTYHATLTINNGNCNSPEYPITITVKPKPVVNNPGNIAVCDGAITPDITFTGTAPSASDYKWVNSNPAIGLAASGEGHILGFAPVNGTPMPVVSTLTVTPVANGCIGESEIFTITSNPVPELNSTLTPPDVCNNTIFSYIPNSLAPGTSFTWSRDAIPGIVNPANSGTDNPNELLTNSTDEPINVHYVYTLTASSCENVQVVTVPVNPTPVLTTPLTPAPLCNSEAFMYDPISSSTSAVITWNRDAVTGISNAAATGTGSINETLLNTTSSPISVTYGVTMTVGSCPYTENVVVTVNPPLMLTSATSLAPVCDMTLVTYTPVPSVPGAEVTWTRDVVAGISNAAGAGTGAFSEALENTTPDNVTAKYAYQIKANGCVNTDTVDLTIKPRPRLSSTLTPSDICTNMYFDYTPASLVTGTTYVWARDVKPGIANGAMMGGGNVHEVLINTTDQPITVPYIYTGSANGCHHQDTVKVVVNPMPKLSNSATTVAVCDSALLTFTPTSTTPGTVFNWSRAYVEGIANLSATGTGNPGERLDNTTYISLPVTYVYTITAAGCNNTQNVTVNVRPSAKLIKTTAVTCSGAPFTFAPESYSANVSYEWSRDTVAGITPATATGEGDIDDVLTHGSSDVVTVVYDYELTVLGCTNKQELTVTVNPAPTVAVIGTHPSVTLCNNTMYQNFGAANPAPSGFTYSWSATNASVLSTGNGGQYAVVNFTTPGTAYVTLTTKNSTTTCTSESVYTVTVSAGSASIPDVIYHKGQFICQDNTMSSYQWGYDDAATMDSVVLDGETNQNYTNEFPDFANRYYWVITDNGGCIQKTYYNRPTGVADVNDIEVGMKLYPNPASSYVNVEVSETVKGNIVMDVYNLMGQKIQSVNAVNNKAQIQIADLPAGAYLVDCHSDGIKVAAARFIKN